MKNWKLSLLTAFGFFAICGMVIFNSCEKDPCMDLTCKNGSCVDGLCQCATGWEGAECTISSASRFLGQYDGHLRCSGQAVVDKTISITLLKSPDSIQISLPFGSGAPVVMNGIAATPEARFTDVINNGVSIHAYATVDGDLIYVYYQTIDSAAGTGTVCRFTGHRN